MESIRTTPSTLNVVRRGDLDSPRIQDKLIDPKEVPSFQKGGEGFYRDTDDASYAAAKTHWVNRLQDQVRARIENTRRNDRSIKVTLESMQPTELDSYTFEGKRVFEKPDRGAGRPRTPSWMPAPVIKAPARTAMRHLDWNPDISLGRRVGVTDIRYVSRENRVDSRQLASRTAPRSAQRAFSRPGGGFVGSGGGSSAGSGSGSSGGGSSAGSGRSVSSGTGSSSGRSSSSAKKDEYDGTSSSSASSYSSASGSSSSSSSGSSSNSGSSSSGSGKKVK